MERKLVGLDKKAAMNANTEANLLLEKVMGIASEQSYSQGMIVLKTERTWISEEKERLMDDLKSIRESQSVILNLKAARQQLADKVSSASNDDWRMIFNALGVRMCVRETGEAEVTLALPIQATAIVSKDPRGWG